METFFPGESTDWLTLPPHYYCEDSHPEPLWPLCCLKLTTNPDHYIWLVPLFQFSWLCSDLSGCFGNNFQQSSDPFLYSGIRFGTLHCSVWNMVTCIKDKYSNPSLLFLHTHILFSIIMSNSITEGLVVALCPEWNKCWWYFKLFLSAIVQIPHPWQSQALRDLGCKYLQIRGVRIVKAWVGRPSWIRQKWVTETREARRES